MSPARKLRKGKKIVVIILAIVMAILFCDMVFKYTYSHINYIHNKKVEIEYVEALQGGFINSQKSTSDFKYGIKNSDYNGCGWISIYNANKILGIDVPISKIINEIDMWGLNIYGILGTNPLAIKNFYRTRGFDTNITTNKSTFEQKISQSKVSVIGYFSTNGGHYQTVIQHSDTEIKLYNSQSTTTLQKYLDKHPNTIMVLVTIK